MRIPPPQVTESEILERQRLGLDSRDEEWEGVYHVTPPASTGHQHVLSGLNEFLRALLRLRGGGTVLPAVGVFRDNRAEHDYRIPDLVFVAAGREGIIARDGIRGGAPDVVFEILSPRDESYLKFDFYASLGVPEVIIVEPETRKTEIWKLNAGSYVQVLPASDGTIVSAQLAVSFRTIAGEQPCLEIADQRAPGNRLSI